jgi:tRNA (guanine-N7-)-methyltransferase
MDDAPGDVRKRGPAHEAFFGRRKGKALRSEQERLLEARIDELSKGLSEPPDDLRRLFTSPVREVRLETGFGGGEHLIHAAIAEPDIGFIGAEPFLNGLAKAIVRIEAEGIANVRLWRDDVRPLLDALPEASLARVYLYYPDPWRKRRHWKRRFLVPDNIARLARVIRPGGELRFATDWSNYASWGVAQVRRDRAFRFTATIATDWTTPWPDFLRTRYEAKAIRDGRVPSYLTFARV